MVVRVRARTVVTAIFKKSSTVDHHLEGQISLYWDEVANESRDLQYEFALYMFRRGGKKQNHNGEI